MKKLFLLLIMLVLAAKIYPQCLNSDFSDGTFQYWTGSTGENSGGLYTNEVMGIVQGTTNSLPTDPGRQTIINQGYFDANTNNLLWTIPPGGTSCARLGNENINYEAERLLYSMAVTPANCIFTYQYAVVLEDPAHTLSDQPKFNIYVLDASNNLIDPTCGVYEVSSQSGIPGFQDATHAADGEADHWKDWTTVGIDLSGYIGQTIHILFATYDCAQGAHFGYAYIACRCGGLQLQQQCTGIDDILTAPPGFASYAWSTGGTAQSETINNPVNGTTVTCTCTSVQGCTMTLSIVLNVQPVVFTVNSPTICSGSTTTLTATGAGYTYVWDGGQTGTSITVSPLATTTYSVTATASGGCTNSQQSTVTVNPLNVSIDSTDENCGQANGTATATPNGGAGPFTYVWSTSPPQYTQTASNLSAGTYSVTVTTSVCTAINQVTINNLPGPSVGISNIINTYCGSSIGGATATATGGAPGYTFQWNSSPPQYTDVLLNVPAGTYVVTVTDINNCTAVNTAIITDSQGPSASVSSTNDICGQGNGTATVNVVGGTGNYTYLWSNGQTTPTATGLPWGPVSVTVNDSNCTITETVNVSETTGPTADFSLHPKITTLMDGPVTFTDHSTSSVVSWIWNYGDGTTDGSGAQTTHQYTNLGTYFVTLVVIDNNGCTDTVVDSVVIKDIFTFYVPNVFTPNGDGMNDFFVPQGISVDPNNYDEYIFDRWGNLVFHTTTWNLTSAEAWNGTLNNKGKSKDILMEVYVYKIRLKEIGGFKHEYFGRITLIP